MKKFITIGIGEILWDMLPDGKMLGGAPANFAYHTHQLGSDGIVISAVGDDILGKEIEEIVEGKGLVNGLSKSTFPTGTVSVELTNGIPDYTIHENVAWDDIQLNEVAKEKLKQANAVCFGSLAQRCEMSQKAIWAALEMVPESCLKVFDINIRQSFFTKDLIDKSLLYADIFKINDEELELFQSMFQLEGSVDELCQQILVKYDLKLLTLTKGSDGSILYTPTEKSDLPTPAVQVIDTIGAGDSFNATMVMGLLYNKPLKVIHNNAIKVSAFVCTQKGATPVLPNNLMYN